MNTALVLAIAMILDAFVGEPRAIWDRVPHPAVLMGRVVGWFDDVLNAGDARRVKGVCTMVAMGAGAVLLGMVLEVFGPVVEVIVVAVLLAQHSLVTHVRAVAHALRLSVGEARRSVAMIVGRDTASMDGPSVARAAIESAAENQSDGVIAPAFWFLIGGLPGLLLYKITNTADSMIGYRTPRHEEFGWAAARFDDLLNVIPARLTAGLIWLSHGRWKGFGAVRADARLHRSPNAGWPEAAMARLLGVALSGPRAYEGQMRDFPFVNTMGKRQIGAQEVEASCTALWRSWGMGLAGVLLLTLLG
jgi:adenosylcobinamide-phosphate synthase